MNVDYLRKLLGRLTKAEFTEFVREWGRLPEAAGLFTTSPTTTKQVLVSTTVKDCQKAGVSEADVDEFDLLYLQKHSKRKTWTVFKVSKDNEVTPHKSVSPAAFKQKLWKELRNYFPVRVSLVLRDGAYWVRTAVVNGRAAGTERAVYLVYYPHTDYIFIADLRVAVVGFISQALASLLGGTAVDPINLTGRCVTSLAQLTIGKDSQGPFSKFRLNQVDGNPIATRKRKRKAEDDEDFDVHVINENSREKRRRESQLEDTFGPNVQPTLEKVTYILETDFAGLSFAPVMAQHEGPFRCRVKFEGRSVIQGMEQLGRAGLAELPMRPHVGRIQSYAQNRFLLRKKDKKGGTSLREG